MIYGKQFDICIIGFLWFTIVRYYVSTKSIWCFDFEFSDKAFSTMDIQSISDMCSTLLGWNLTRKPRIGLQNESSQLLGLLPKLQLEAEV